MKQRLKWMAHPDMDRPAQMTVDLFDENGKLVKSGGFQSPVGEIVVVHPDTGEALSDAEIEMFVNAGVRLEALPFDVVDWVEISEEEAKKLNDRLQQGDTK